MKKTAVSSIQIAVVLLGVAVIAEAQSAKKIPRIGFLVSGSPSSTLSNRKLSSRGSANQAM